MAQRSPRIARIHCDFLEDVQEACFLFVRWGPTPHVVVCAGLFESRGGLPSNSRRRFGREFPLSLYIKTLHISQAPFSLP